MARISLLSANLAHADSVYKPDSSDAESGVDLVIGAGATFGGDELATVTFTSGSTESVDAGALLDLKIGFEYFLTGHQFSLQSTIGYHFDSVDAQNGDLSFSRMPIDIIGFVNRGSHRFGLTTQIRLIYQLFQQRLPGFFIPPTAKPAMGVFPITVVRRQIPPRRTGSRYPEDGVRSNYRVDRVNMAPVKTTHDLRYHVDGILGTFMKTLGQ